MCLEAVIYGTHLGMDAYLWHMQRVKWNIKLRWEIIFARYIIGKAF